MQTLSRGRVRNLHPFGTLLAATARRLLPDFLERREHGFQDGGCAIMARALAIWSQGRMTLGSITLASDPVRVQHVVAIADGVLLDSDGVATERDMILKMERIEMRPGCILAPGFEPTRTPGIPWDETESSHLADGLHSMLPDPATTPWRNVAFPSGTTGVKQWN